MDTSLKLILSKFEGKNEELIPILQAAQEALGFLPKDLMLKIARFIHITIVQTIVIIPHIGTICNDVMKEIGK